MNCKLNLIWIHPVASRVVTRAGQHSVLVVSRSSAGHTIGRDGRGLLRVVLPDGSPLRRRANRQPARPVAWFRNLRNAQHAAELAT
jgi:hypothetical protein